MEFPLISGVYLDGPCVVVLGGDLRRAWYRPNWYLSRRLRSSAWKNQRILQRSHRL